MINSLFHFVLNQITIDFMVFEWKLCLSVLMMSSLLSDNNLPICREESLNAVWSGLLDLFAIISSYRALSIFLMNWKRSLYFL